MVRRVIPVILLILLLTTAFGVYAQPALPDIGANITNNGIQISWISQYNSVKAISILRSRDSINDFEVIGYLKTPQPGAQSYTDGHPLPGRSFYKLAIAFNKGLTWRSNPVGISLARVEAAPVAAATAAPKNDKAAQKVSGELESSFHSPSRVKKMPDTCRVNTNKTTVSISADTSVHEPPRPKVRMSFDEPVDNIPIFIHSRYVHTDSITGHVYISLPEDVTSHHYSIKFFDKDKHMITEVPRINSSKIILDKRNFQHYGVYKFALRKDYLEIESGYIVVNP